MLSFYLSMVKTQDDRDKVTFIYENFYPLMKYVAVGYVKRNEDAEDIVQESMISIIECIDKISISDQNRLKNLCAIVARNKAIDFLRASGNRCLPLDDAPVLPADDGDIPEKTVVIKESYDLILKAINGLSDTYRDVCLLKYVNQLKEKEIALLLNLSPKAVSMRIFRGKQILREAIRKENVRG